MSDVTVHVDENLDARSLHRLQHELAHMRGVEKIDADDRHPQLMVVRYDHRETDSRQILSTFFGHGYHAELIGF